jgi:hypothetical protein
MSWPGPVRFRQPAIFLPFGDFVFEMELGAPLMARKTRRKVQTLRTWIVNQILARFDCRILRADLPRRLAICRSGSRRESFG